MTIRHLLIAAAIGSGLMSTPRLAAADVEGYVYWSMPAQGCTPGTLALREERYATWLNYVSWNGSNLDLLAFWCPVAPNTGETSPTTMKVTVLDDSGTATDTFVDATLYKVNRSTGAYGTCQ